MMDGRAEKSSKKTFSLHLVTNIPTTPLYDDVFSSLPLVTRVEHALTYLTFLNKFKS